MSARPIAIVGCGNIAPAYLQNLVGSAEVQVVALADADQAKAKALADRFGIAKIVSPFDAPRLAADVLVLNLTPPAIHFDVCANAVENASDVYTEKPLCSNFSTAQRLMAMAEANGVQVGCAPDTVLGAGTQTARKALDDGLIGRPVSVQAFMMCGGHESWHPSPEFYYKTGGGPLHDMGPYYLSCLVTLLGPIKRVTGMAQITHASRTITSQPLNGTTIAVDTPTHIVAVMEFANGVIANLTTSFDTPVADLPHIEIHGTTGAMRVPDPNGFGGDVLVRTPTDSSWKSIPSGPWEAGAGRGLGVIEMVRASRAGQQARASGQLALHVLEVMDAVLQASSSGISVDITTVVSQPEPMPPGTLCRS